MGVFSFTHKMTGSFLCVLPTSLDLGGNKYKGQIKINKLVEKYRKDAYIEDFSLRSSQSDSQANFAFDTQQVFGEIEIISEKAPEMLKFFTSESEDEASFKSLVPINIKNEKGKTIYDFDKFAATFIKIEGDLKDIDKIRLRSVKIKL